MRKKQSAQTLLSEQTNADEMPLVGSLVFQPNKVIFVLSLIYNVLAVV